MKDKQLVRELGIAAIISLVLGLIRGLMVPGLLLIGTLILILASVGLILFIRLAEKRDRPITWQVILISIFGLAIGYMTNLMMLPGFSSNWNHSIKNMILNAAIGCIIAVIFEKKIIKKQFNSKIDQCIPAIWTMIVGMLMIGIVKGDRSGIVNDCLIIIIVIAMIISASLEAVRKANPRVDYRITSKGYFQILIPMFVVVIVVSSILPAVKEPPFQRQVKEMINELMNNANDNSEMFRSQLSRTPDQSEYSVVNIIGDKTLEKQLLRRRAFQTYSDGGWQGEDEENYVWTEFDGSKIINEYDILRQIITKSINGDIYLDDLYNIDGLVTTPDDWTEDDLGRLKEHNAIVSELSNSALSMLSISSTSKIFAITDSEALRARESSRKGEEISFKDDTKSTERIGYIGKLENANFNVQTVETPKNYEIIYKAYSNRKGLEFDIIRHMTKDEILELFNEAASQDKEIEYVVNKWKRSTYISEKAQGDNLQVPDEIEDDLYDLAEAITEEEIGELNKAEAICSYLKDSGEYTYQIGAGYTDAEVDPIIDFLYNGKSGICQDFASSMVMLCRSIGIPARYVTGYTVATEPGAEGYTIREKDAHAFVEAYITGYGWMTFDPTAAQQTVAGTNTKNNVTNNLVNGFITLLLAVVVILIIWKVAVASIVEFVWHKWVQMIRKDQQAEAIMNRTIDLIEKNGVAKEETETLQEFAERTKEKLDIDLHPIIKIYEDYYYGGMRIDRQMIEDMLASYKNIRESIKENKKKKQQMLIQKFKTYFNLGNRPRKGKSQNNEDRFQQDKVSNQWGQAQQGINFPQKGTGSEEDNSSNNRDRFQQDRMSNQWGQAQQGINFPQMGAGSEEDNSPNNGDGFRRR